MADPRRKKQTDSDGRRGGKPRRPLPEEDSFSDEESASSSEEEVVVEVEAEPEAEQAESSEMDDLKDRYQRLAAEFDNYRKRQARDFNRLIAQGRRKLIEELLTVLDNFDRARVTCQGEHSDKEIVDGIMQTSDQLLSVLQKEGLEVVPTTPGDLFDPNVHEAMVAEAIDTGDADIVLEVYQKAYIFGKDLVRPARVKVGKVSTGNGG